MSELRGSRDTPVAFDPLNGRLRRGAAILALRPKDAAVLLQLAERPGQLIPKALLIRTAWPGISVSEGVLKASLAFPAYYLGLSFWLGGRLRRET